MCKSGQFRLRTLLLAVLAAALLFAGLHYFINSSRFDVEVRTGTSPLIAFAVSNQDEVRALETEFDRAAFLAIVKKRFAASSPNAELGDVAAYPGTFDSCFVIHYDYQRWPANSKDPLANQRAAAITKAFLEAGQEWAKDKPTVLRIEHSP